MQDFDQHAFARQLAPTTVELSVSEMIELAKAGVAVELAGKVQVDRTYRSPTPLPTARDRDISEGIRERYLQSQRSKKVDDFIYGSSPIQVPDLCAFQHGDKVYVFAYSGNSPPEVIEDDAAIYPSDALLARIHLMMQHGK
jgi:hypothetical protein